MSQTVQWDQSTFDALAGIGVFVGLLLLLNDTYPELAWLIVGGAILELVVSHGSQLAGLLGNYSTALRKVRGAGAGGGGSTFPGSSTGPGPGGSRPGINPTG